MRRKLTMLALVAMMLAAAAGPAAAQSPNIQLQVQPKLQIQPKLQVQPKLQPKIQPRLQAQPKIKPPMIVKIQPSVAMRNAQRMLPGSKALDVKLLPSGNYVIKLRQNNQLQRVIINGTTGAPQ